MIAANCASRLLATAGSRTYFELSRLQYMEQWWQWPLLFLLGLLVVTYVTFLYRRDGASLSVPLRWLLTLLRLAAFAGLFVFFLGIEKRTEYKIVKNSRAVVAVDTSQSMGLVDADATQNANGQSRAEQVAKVLPDLLDGLREQHDVVVYRFDETDQPIQLAAYSRTGAPIGLIDQDDDLQRTQRSFVEAGRLAKIAAGLLGIGLLALVVHWVASGFWRGREGESWALLVGVMLLLVAMVVTAVNNLRNPQYSMIQLLRGDASPDFTEQEATAETETDDPSRSIDWSDTLQPAGVATKLGSAVQYFVDRERGGPIAGVCLISDGNSNAGMDWREVASFARDAEIPLYPIGVGTDRPPMNVRIVDIESPPRVYPGDAFNITAFLQAYGMEGKSVNVQLFSVAVGRTATETENASELLLDEARLRLGEDGAVVPIEFEVVPEQAGKVRYQVRIDAPSGDLDQRDNRQVVDVRIVDRRSRVLLLASGPTREYRFLRVLLYRDKEVELDIYMQGAAPEMAQEADALLDEFPTTAEAMFNYDCVVAFDPDWMSLSDVQIGLLERWVAEKAGGLILVAGQVYTPEWTSLSRTRPADETIKSLYPVSFYRRSSALLSRGRFSATKPWPLEFSADGFSAPFTQLDDAPSINQEIWASFPGVYGYQTVRGAKPGATVYARFSNPDSSVDGELPVYLAGQFYGAGRVLYLGSGEMWRLNELDISYFEQFYTKLLRYASEGRLLRDSSRGVLLVSKDRCLLGETVGVRASLSDAQFRPLDQEKVDATLIGPDGIRRPLALNRIQETSQAGAFSGQFHAVKEGDYRVELAIPDSPEIELLEKTVRVRLPDREVESPQRNDATLSELASTTGGTYFVGLDKAMTVPQTGQDDTTAEAPMASIVASMTPQDQETYFPGAPDKDFQQRQMAWLLALISLTLSSEWLIRRVSRLA